MYIYLVLEHFKDGTLRQERSGRFFTDVGYWTWIQLTETLKDIIEDMIVRI